MATQHANSLSHLLGKSLTIREVVYGFPFERQGQVIGIINGLPGSSCEDAFLLDQQDGSCDFYTLSSVTILSVE